MTNQEARAGYQPEHELSVVSRDDFVLGILEALAHKYGQFGFVPNDRDIHAAFSATFEHLRETHGDTYWPGFRIYPNYHGYSEALDEAFAFVQMIGRHEWGERTYVDMVVRSRDDEVYESTMQAFPGGEELYEELADVFIDSYGLERL